MSNIYDALRKAGGDEPPERKRAAAKEKAAAPAAPAGEAEAPPVPAAGARLVPRGSIAGHLIGEPDLAFLKELDRLRASLEVTLGARLPHRVGFLAATTGEGTTTLAMHFAHLMAHLAERRVLLVDADMGRSNVALSAVVEDRDGLTELLRGERSAADVVLATEEPNLHFLPAGRDQVRYVETTTPGRLRTVLTDLSHYYDWIVVDIAPVLRHPEASVIGAATDGLVFIVRAHRTSRDVARRAMEELNVARCRILGTVLNARREPLPGFLRERV